MSLPKLYSHGGRCFHNAQLYRGSCCFKKALIRLLIKISYDKDSIFHLDLCSIIRKDGFFRSGGFLEDQGEKKRLVLMSAGKVLWDFGEELLRVPEVLSRVKSFQKSWDQQSLFDVDWINSFHKDQFESSNLIYRLLSLQVLGGLFDHASSQYELPKVGLTQLSSEELNYVYACSIDLPKIITIYDLDISHGRKMNSPWMEYFNEDFESLQPVQIHDDLLQFSSTQLSVVGDFPAQVDANALRCCHRVLDFLKQTLQVQHQVFI